jgi:hypothetical protein
MRRIAIVQVLTLASALRASVAETATYHYPCMTQEDAQQVADNWQYINAGYTQILADVSVVANFTAYSNSMITEINGPATCGPGPVLVSRDRQFDMVTSGPLTLIL